MIEDKKLHRTIVYIGGFELPDKNAAAQRVLSNAKVFRDSGYNVVLIGVCKSNNPQMNILKTKSIESGFETYHVDYPNSLKKMLTYISDASDVERVLSNLENVEHVICYNYPAISLLKIRKYCKKNKIKIIADCTEWYSANERDFFHNLFKYIDTTLRMGLIHKKLDGLIVISDYLKKYYQKTNKVIVIPPLVDLSEEKWSMPILNQKEHPRLIYCGSPGRNKDKVNFVIEALYILENKYDYLFQVVGITKQQYLEAYPEHQHYIDTLANRVVFMGRLSHKQCIELIKKADFNIFLRENTRLVNAGFPTKFPESLSCNTPVITTDVSDLSKYLVEGKNGYFVEIGNPISLEKVLCKIFENKKCEREIMKLYCHTASNPFRYENFISPVKTFFDEII